MLDIQKILVPTDFSDNASCAYGLAQQLASKYGAIVDFIHIIPTLQYFRESINQLGMPLDIEKEVYPHAQQQASKRIQKLMDEHLKSENKGTDLVHISSKPSKAITDYATSEDYDIIVVGAKGQDDADEMKGSTTERIIRYSDIPVLHSDSAEMKDIATILLPTDGSQTSLNALPLAISIARSQNAVIRLLYIIEQLGTSTENIVKYVPKKEAHELKETIYKALDEFLTNSSAEITHQEGKDFDSNFILDDDSSSTVNIRTVIEKGTSAHKSITDYGTNHTDITVMATHGRGGFSHLLLGSTAEKVAQHIQGPLLTIKPSV